MHGTDTRAPDHRSTVTARTARVFPFAALILGLACAPTSAEGLVKPGAIIVPFRDFDTKRNVLLPAPPPDYAGTCWRITSVRGDKVGIELVKGVFKPAWENGKSFEHFQDETDLTAYGKFTFDLDKGEFSIFRVQPRCP